MPQPMCGTAHLFGLVDAAESRAFLQAAYDCGYRSFDTAPSYGFGLAEPELAGVLGARRAQVVISTKVGLEPAPAPSRTLRGVKAVARRLPGGLQQRLRGGDGPAPGRFETGAVRASVERSLRRLGHLDRLLLHEVAPADVSVELVDLLDGYRQRGDVRELGVATRNDLTAACVERAPELLTVAHQAVGPEQTEQALRWPESVTVRVGHGLLGAGGSELRRLAVDADGVWRQATQGTDWAGFAGLARALLTRAADPALGLTDAIIATSRPATLADTRALVSGEQRLPASVSGRPDTPGFLRLGRTPRSGAAPGAAPSPRW